MPVASLPMYDLPETRAEMDHWWAGLVRHMAAEGLTGVPRTLAHDRLLESYWEDPALWLSQTCGYPLVYRYAERLQPVATPLYDTPDCRGAAYASVVMVAAQSPATDVADLRGTVCAINGPESHSGMNALRALVAPLSRDGRFFAEVRISGAHALSLEMLRRGEADVAAVDCVTYALLARHRPAALDGLRRLCVSAHAPGLPIVVPATVDADTVARLRAALRHALADCDLAAARQALLIKGFEVLAVADYRPIMEMQEQAARHGYAVLA